MLSHIEGKTDRRAHENNGYVFVGDIPNDWIFIMHDRAQLTLLSLRQAVDFVQNAGGKDRLSSPSLTLLYWEKVRNDEDQRQEVSHLSSPAKVKAVREVQVVPYFFQRIEENERKNALGPFDSVGPLRRWQRRVTANAKGPTGNKG